MEYFLAVVEHGGFTNAARVLHVSQPSLSHSIAALEAELGGALFHRLPHGAILTSAGEALVPAARQVSRDLVTAAAAVREVLGLSGGRLDIVAQTTLAVDPLARLLGLFLRRFPQVMVNVTDPQQDVGVARLVRNSEAELGLMDSTVAVGDLESLHLARQRLVLVMPPNHPVGDPVGLADLAETRFVVTPRGSDARTVLDEALDRAGITPLVSVQTVHRAMIVPLVIAGAGATFLPELMARDAEKKGATLVPTDPELHYRAQLVWRPGPLSPAAASFVALTRSRITEPKSGPIEDVDGSHRKMV